MHPANRFVVLRHRQRASQIPAWRREYLSDHSTTPYSDQDVEDVHYDLMLETEHGLQTWALAAIPTPGTTQRAVRLPVHRVEYLEYQGAVSNDRGSVQQVLCGTFLTDGNEIILRADGRELRITVTEIAPPNRFQFEIR